MLFVEARVELTAVLVEGGPRIAESLPQLLAGGLGQTGAGCLVGLPLLEEGRHLGARLLPLDRLRVACGDRLDALDECGALGDGGVDGGALGLRLFGRRLAEGGVERREASLEGGEVADGGRADDALAHGARGGAEVGCRGATGAVTRFEQRDLAGEVGELALEVGEGLGGRAVGVLADDAPLVALAHRHGAVVVDAPERFGGCDGLGGGRVVVRGSSGVSHR